MHAAVESADGGGRVVHPEHRSADFSIENEAEVALKSGVDPGLGLVREAS